MNTKELTFMLIAAIMGLFVSSCSEDDEEEVHLSVEIKADGTTSNGSIFSAIDDKNFYLDYVKYTIESGHLEVSDFDKANLKGNVTIPATITYKGTSYNVLSVCDHAFFRYAMEQLPSLLVIM